MPQTLLITGAGRGVGRALTEAALARGDRVLAGVRDAAAAPSGAQPLVVDVTDPASLTAAAASLGGGAVDVLVCNAGVYAGRGGIEDPAYTPEAWAQVMAVNVAGPFFTVRAFLPALKRSVRPRVAVISSQMGVSARAKGSAYIYRASKAAATNLAMNLAVELAPVAVGSYHPGWVRTDMGGSGADIAPGESAAGLLARFDALGPDHTGVVEDWRGEPLPF